MASTRNIAIKIKVIIIRKKGKTYRNDKFQKQTDFYGRSKKRGGIDHKYFRGCLGPSPNLRNSVKIGRNAILSNNKKK